jgi:hypothetical protein
MKNISLFRSAYSIVDAKKNADMVRKDLFFLFRYKYYVTYWKTVCKKENRKNLSLIDSSVYRFLHIFREFEKSPFVPEKPKDEHDLHIRIMDLIRSITSGKDRSKHGKFTQNMRIHVLRITERLLFYMNLNKIQNVDMAEANFQLIQHEKTYDYTTKHVTRLTAFLENPAKLRPEHNMDVAFDIMRINETESDSSPDDVTESDSPPDDVTESDSPPDDVTKSDSPPDDVTESDSPPDDVTKSDSPPDDVTESDSSDEDVATAPHKRIFSTNSQVHMRKRIKLKSDIEMMSSYSHIPQKM